MGWGPGGRARGVNTKGGNTSSFLLTLKYTRPVFSFFFFPVQGSGPNPHAPPSLGDPEVTQKSLRGGLGVGAAVTQRRRVCRRPGGAVSNSGDSERYGCV